MYIERLLNTLYNAVNTTQGWNAFYLDNTLNKLLKRTDKQFRNQPIPKIISQKWNMEKYGV